MTVQGGSGTIGGTGMLLSAKGAVFEEGVTAPTFHGDLDGTRPLLQKLLTLKVTLTRMEAVVLDQQDRLRILPHLQLLNLQQLPLKHS